MRGIGLGGSPIKAMCARFFSWKLRRLLAKHDDLDWAEKLAHCLRNGANPDTTDSWKVPALCVAASRGDATAIKHLLDSGANVMSSRPFDGKTALEIAAIWKYNEHVVHTIITHTRCLDASHGAFKTILMRVLASSVSLGRLAIVEELLLHMDTLQSERHEYISVVTLEHVFGILVTGAGCRRGILEAILGAIQRGWGWKCSRSDLRKNIYNNHVIGETVVYEILDPVSSESRLGQILLEHIHSDYGMGTESTQCTGAIILLYLAKDAAARVASSLIPLVRQMSDGCKV